MSTKTKLTTCFLLFCSQKGEERKKGENTEGNQNIYNLLSKLLLSKKRQDTSHKLYSGVVFWLVKIILVSTIVLCLATFE